MAVKYPIEYELEPERIRTGVRWLTLRVKNVGTETLTGLDVRLNSFDTYSLLVYGSGEYIGILEPGEEEVLPFQVSSLSTTSVYTTMDGWRAGEPFHWESPATLIRVGEDVAELVSLFAMAEPYLTQGETVRCEASVRGLGQSEGLTLEFWAYTPDGAFEELATIETKPLSAGEVAHYSAEVTVEDKGAYTVYAYLYEDGFKRLGRKIEHVYVS